VDACTPTNRHWSACILALGISKYSFCLKIRVSLSERFVNVSLEPTKELALDDGCHPVQAGDLMSALQYFRLIPVTSVVSAGSIPEDVW
jgi:hypothetical protein